MLKKDAWLSDFFPKGAYRYAAPFELIDLPSGFIFAKVPANDLESFNKLTSLGFKLIEVLVTFVQTQQPQPLFKSQDLRGCRFARSEDKTQVLNIAKNAFSYSRFYQDQNILKKTASELKEAWVANYFDGNRGSDMVVVENNSIICGFILLIDRVIDLIAVSPEYFRQGIASKMLTFVNQKKGLLKAGTQLTNEASIRMYQKSGFMLGESVFVLHRHSIYE